MINSASVGIGRLKASAAEILITLWGAASNLRVTVRNDGRSASICTRWQFAL